MTPSLLLTPMLAYLLGSVPVGYLLARWTAGVDVRRAGSGNVGATNVVRVAGPLPGVAVLLLDAGKGALAVAAAGWLTREPLAGSHWLRLVCGASVVIGHVWPCFLRFQGGKGIATALGVLMMVWPEAAGVCAAVWAVVFGWKRYVSLASIAAALSLPVYALIRLSRIEVVVFSVFLAWLAVWRHQANIRRLYLGQEPAFGRRR